MPLRVIPLQERRSLAPLENLLLPLIFLNLSWLNPLYWFIWTFSINLGKQRRGIARTTLGDALASKIPVGVRHMVRLLRLRSPAAQ